MANLAVQAVVAIKDKVNTILPKVRQINTWELQGELEREVFRCFESLKPFSYKRIVLTEVDDHGYSKYIILSKWLMEKRSWHKYGAPIKYKDDFFTTIRKYGKLAAPYVRIPIRDEFSELVDLVTQLIPYRTISVKLELDEPMVVDIICLESSLTIRKLLVRGLEVSTWSPSKVKIYTNPHNDDYYQISICSTEDLFIIEPLIDHLVKLYDIVTRKVMVVKKHNDEILGKMKDVVAPFMLAKELC